MMQLETFGREERGEVDASKDGAVLLGQHSQATGRGGGRSHCWSVNHCTI